MEIDPPSLRKVLSERILDLKDFRPNGLKPRIVDFAIGVRNRRGKGAAPRQARDPELVEWASLRPYAIRSRGQSPSSGFRVPGSEFQIPKARSRSFAPICG